MDFFAQQAQIRNSSRTLVWLFALAVLAIVVAVDLVCAFVLGVGLRAPSVSGVGGAVRVVLGLSSRSPGGGRARGGAAGRRARQGGGVTAGTAHPQWRRP